MSFRRLLNCSLLLVSVSLFAESFQCVSAQAQWSTQSNTNNIYYNSGTVGIGTQSPQAKLHVEGSSAYNVSGIFSAIYAKGTADYPMALMLDGAGTSDNVARLRALNNGQTKWQVNFADDITYYSWSNNTFNPRLTVGGGGNVGIGTSSPTDRLVVDKSSAESAVTVNADAAQQSTLYFSSAGAKTSAIYRPASSNDLRFNIVGVGDALTMQTSTGNIGIGTTLPNEKLDVAGNGKITGNLTVTGNIAAKYQDVAEWVPSSEQVQPGTVVVLDQTKSNQVVSSKESYDTRVAGVVSEKPGIVLGDGGAGKILVATTGRVLVKVDASQGPIHIGDLLVTSDIPGVAMKSEPVQVGKRMMHLPGTLIGKALEPLEKGSGKILVLLSLQ